MNSRQQTNPRPETDKPMTCTIVEAELPADEFALQRTLSELATVQFDIERVVAHDNQHTMPFVWASGRGSEPIDEALAADSSVANHRRLADLDEGWLYRIDCVDGVETAVRILTEGGGAILSASGRDGRWTLKLRFSERDALSTMYENSREFGLSLDIRSIYELDEHRPDSLGLSPIHRETLITAFERGYFEIPRGITLSELAVELGVSHQALSERLRRSYRLLIERTVVGGTTDDGFATGEIFD